MMIKTIEEEHKNMNLDEHKDVKHMKNTEEEVKKPRTFNYELNEEKAKTKLLKGAMKPMHMDIEVKTTCVNLRFDDGSFKEVVLPLLRNWSKKDKEPFEFMGAMIRVVESDDGEDNIKNHIDKKMVVMYDKHKIVLHGYNGTQNLIVQGKQFQKFALNVLKPYFSRKIEEFGDDIDSFNTKVQIALGKPKIKINNKKEHKKFPCPHCKVKSSTVGDLKMHLKSSHSFITKKKKSLTLNEDLSLLDESLSDKEETLSVLPSKEPVIECDWDPCGYKSSDKGIMMKHIDEEHIGILKQKYLGEKNAKGKAELDTDDEQMHSHTQFEEIQGENISLQESVLICGTCAKSFEYEREFSEHLCEHTTSNSFKCISCELTFQTTRDLDSHETEHVSQNCNQYVEPLITSVVGSEAESVSCHFCLKIFKNLADLEVHIENVHTVNLTKHQVDAANEILIEQNEICFKCEKCNFIGNASDLETHIDKKHGKIISCKDCGINFSDEDILNEHEGRKHNKQPYPCDVCGLVLANSTLLQEHKITIHKQSCRYCNFTAKTSEDLEEHLIYHHEEYIILHSMAKQMDRISAQFNTVETFGKQLSTYETFMADILSVLKSLQEGQNVMKQELFILRNSQHNTKKKDLKERSPDPVSPPPQVEPSVSSEQRASTPTPTPSGSKSSSSTRSPSNVLFVGDSIANSLDTKAISKVTNVNITKVKAFSSVKEEVSKIAKQAAKFPHQNFTDVCQKELNKRDVDILIMQGGSVDITNINTRDNATEHFDFFNEETLTSAETSLKNNQNLQKVVILKQTPRYDNNTLDPLQIKPALSDIFNNKLTDLWMKSSLKSKIHVGSHNIECTGGIREARYRCTLSGRYDGVHLYGPSGMKAYTNSVLEILKRASIITNDCPPCPQFQYQNRWSVVPSTRRCYSSEQDKDIRYKNNRNQFNSRKNVNHNRYEVLSQAYQGNF